MLPVIALATGLFLVGATAVLWQRRGRRAAGLAALLLVVGLGIVAGRPPTASAASDCPSSPVTISTVAADPVYVLPIIPVATVAADADVSSEAPVPVVPEVPLPVVLGVCALLLFGVRFAVGRRVRATN